MRTILFLLPFLFLVQAKHVPTLGHSNMTFNVQAFETTSTYYFYQLLDELALFNGDDCLFYGYSVGQDIVTAGSYLLQLQLWQATL